jgi:hypothetical protein
MDIEGLACEVGDLNRVTVLGFPPGSIIIRELRIVRPGGSSSLTTIAVSFDVIDWHPHFASRMALLPDRPDDP